MSKVMTESEVEYVCLCLLGDLDYAVASGPDISEGIAAERNYNEVVLVGRLRDALRRINKGVPDSAIEEAIKRVVRTDSQDLVQNNEAFHRLLTGGVPVQYKRADGSVKDDSLWLFDFRNVGSNDFLAVNQFTVIEERINRRADIVLFVNGLPLVLVELKNPADENASVSSAYKQLQTYMKEIPSIFRFNEILVISDGTYAKAGTITSPEERFSVWKEMEAKKPDIPPTQIELLINGMLNPKVLLDLVHSYVAFEPEKQKDGSIRVSKKIAQYQQYRAVQKAIAKTTAAIKRDRRGGVVWHTQGSGKSLTMVFYAGKMALNPELENPTIVMLTDRNDLDGQLFDTFARNHVLLRQDPVQADSREELRGLLKVASGGIIFTTIQKFYPEGNEYPQLSDRKNIIVVADEAHRSQYGFGLKVPKNLPKQGLKYGYAKYMRDALPNATFVGFTGTPIEKADHNTRKVFGDYIDVYDIKQSVEDGSTVGIIYESRLAKIELKPEARPYIDENFEEVTEGEEIEGKEYLKSKWSRLEKVVGSPDRIKRLASDIVDHWEKRLSVLDGKAMIVCMSRRICVELHNEIVKLRPQWYDADDKRGILKVVMTGSAADGPQWQEHIRNKQRRHELLDRMKDPADPFKVVIVRDMWLTGVDVPSLHTMYIDKPMNGHTLMQAIARVNRVFKDKKSGLIVDYIGLATELEKALAEYTEDNRELTRIPQDVAVGQMMARYEATRDMFHGFDYRQFFKATPQQRMGIMMQAMEHILAQQDGKNRYLKEVTNLLYAFTVAMPHEKAMEIRDDVGFFQAVKAAIVKNTDTRTVQEATMDTAIKQILSEALVSDRVIDVFAAAGFKKPNLDLFSDEFLENLKTMPQKNLAFETLRKLLSDQIRFQRKKNLVQARSFEELLDKSIRAYMNRSIDTAQVVQQLADLAKTVKAVNGRGIPLGLSEEEVAFYDALADNESAKQLLGDKVLMQMARELVDMIRNNVTIDWTIRDNVQAHLRVMVKKLLKRYKYPPDKQEKATQTVLDQAKLLCKDWAEPKKGE